MEAWEVLFMSLQYIIDGYNIINHTLFLKQKDRKTKEQKHELLNYIKREGLGGSLKNKITVVYDGYPPHEFNQDKAFTHQIEVIFSRNISADDKIKKIVEESAMRKNIVVVSDDKEVRFIAKSLGAKCAGVEDFICLESKSQRESKRETLKHELSYSQMHRINQELRKLWLKQP